MKLLYPRTSIFSSQRIHSIFKRPHIEGAGVAQTRAVRRYNIRAGAVHARIQNDESSAVEITRKDETGCKKMIPPHLLKRLSSQLWKAVGTVPFTLSGKLFIAVTKVRRRIAHSLVVLGLNTNERPGSGSVYASDEDIERRAIAGVPRITPAGRPLKVDRLDTKPLVGGEPTEPTAGEVQVKARNCEQIERERLTREQVVENARGAVEFAAASFRVQYFSPYNLANRVVEIIRQRLLRPWHGQPRAKRTLTASAPVRTHGVATLFTPQRLKNSKLSLVSMLIGRLEGVQPLR